MSTCSVCNKYDAPSLICSVFGRTPTPIIHTVGDLDHEGRLLLRTASGKPVVTCGAMCDLCKQQVLKCARCGLRWDVLHLPARCTFVTTKLGPCHSESSHYCRLCWKGFSSSAHLIQVRALPEDLVPHLSGGVITKTRKTKHRERFGFKGRGKNDKKKKGSDEDDEDDDKDHLLKNQQQENGGGGEEEEEDHGNQDKKVTMAKIQGLLETIMKSVSPTVRQKIQNDLDEIELTSIGLEDMPTNSTTTTKKKGTGTGTGKSPQLTSSPAASKAGPVKIVTLLAGQKTMDAAVCRDCLNTTSHQICSSCETVVMGRARMTDDCFNH